MLNLNKSKLLLQESEKYLAGGVSSGIRKLAEPLLFFEHADGPYFYDVDGNQYIDYTLAWGPLILGSNHPAINSAVSSQIRKSYTFGAQHELEIKLSKIMTEVIPGVENVIFSNTGTEAVQAALRIARAYTGKNKILKFEGHYHGWANNVLVSFRPTVAQLGTPTATCGGQPSAEFADTIVLPWNDITALEKVVATQGHEIACMITEPILANSGCCMPQNGYLEALVNLCKKNNIISIFDEVITGFRIALGGAREYFNVIPDLSVYAKAMAGGFTISAVGGRREIFDVLRNGKSMHAGTYNGSSFNMAAALATIQTLAEPGTYTKMNKIGDEIQECFLSGAKEKGIPLVISGTGCVFSVHFEKQIPPVDYSDILKSNSKLYPQFRRKILEEGILLLPDGRWYISAVHTEKELSKTKTAILKAIRSLT